MHTIIDIDTRIAQLEDYANCAVAQERIKAAIPVYILAQVITCLQSLRAEVIPTRWEKEQALRRESLAKQVPDAAK